ncbi:MAG: substrate-binding domain-containing protein, partial [Spirochaetales bacterium]|nr:substrate-binding domain-containing protein [Spirochaetales bacterium]
MGKKKSLPPSKTKYPGRGRIIALLGDELNYEIPIKIFNTIKELAGKYNYDLLYIGGEAYKSPIEFSAQSNILYNLISSRAVDGLITISNLLSAYTSPRKFYKRYLEFLSIPVVSLGIVFEGIPSVVPDNSTGMNEAVCHLIEDHNYTRIAFLSGTQEHPDVIERFSAFTRAMEAHNLPVDPSLLLKGNFQSESGSRAVRELLDTRGKKPGQDVQAIVCCNDYMASGAILELQSRSIRIPEEIALVGFDGLHITECLVPSLSSVAQPFHTMAIKATELLFKLISGESVPEVVRVLSRFIPHRSCGCTDKLTQTGQKHLKLSPPYFPEHINRQILGLDMSTRLIWKQAISHLREKAQWNRCSTELRSDSKESRLPAEDAERNNNQEIWDILSDTVYNSFANTNYTNMVQNMGINITSHLELCDLLLDLHNKLPGIGIKRCCICLYENPENSTGVIPPWSRLILAFNPVHPLNLPPEGLRFHTENLLPEEIINREGWKNWVVMALYFQNEQFGFMFIDSEIPNKNIYNNLRKQISTALKGNQLLKETRKANNLLNEANEQKTQFFINLAHETKTPLTLIRNYLSRYIEQHAPDENLQVIKQNIDLLLSNMLNFMDVEKLQKGVTVFQHDILVNLSEGVEQKCTIFSEVAKTKKIRIVWKIEENIIIRIDPYALDRILNNLLDNAVKYIQEEGKIWVKVSRKEDHAILRISDNGPGLPVETSEHLFEPYYLLSRKKTGQQGVGVGLSIVKKIADEIAASIVVEKNKSGGACFTISFKASKTLRPGESAQTIPSISPSPLVRGIINEKNISPEKPSLLVVDDNVQLLKLIQSALEETYNIFLARDV